MTSSSTCAPVWVLTRCPTRASAARANGFGSTRRVLTRSVAPRAQLTLVTMTSETLSSIWSGSPTVRRRLRFWGSCALRRSCGPLIFLLLQCQAFPTTPSTSLLLLRLPTLPGRIAAHPPCAGSSSGTDLFSRSFHTLVCGTSRLSGPGGAEPTQVPMQFLGLCPVVLRDVAVLRLVLISFAGLTAVLAWPSRGGVRP